MQKLGIIGLGPWGRNYVRIFHRLVGKERLVVCDLNHLRRSETQTAYPEIEATGNYLELLKRPDIIGVVIATPPQTHFLLARASLLAGKHTLIEQPVVESLLQAEAIFQLGRKKELVVMAGHLMVFHPVAEKVRQMLTAGRLGQLQYIFFNQANPQTYSSREKFLWNVIVHDLALLEYWLGEEPGQIKASGVGWEINQAKKAISVLMLMPGGCMVHLFETCCHPVKVRKIVLVGNRGSLVFDDLEPGHKLQFFSGGGNTPDQCFPAWTEPLERECCHFLECITRQIPPCTGEQHTLWVMRNAEKILNHLADD